jgi:hypothetical protein
MNRMKSTATERRLVVILFVLVLITFSLAQHDSKRLNRLYTITTEKKENTASATQNLEPRSYSK